MNEGRALRDEGMARADFAAGEAWRSSADAAILRFAASRQPFVADDVIAEVGLPAHRNAIGARFNAAARRGIIRAVGYAQSERRARHASRSLRWIGTGAEPTVTAGPVNGSGEERFSPAAPVEAVRDGPQPVELWRCTKCSTQRPGPLASGLLDTRYAEAHCSVCKARTLHGRAELWA